MMAAAAKAARIFLKFMVIPHQMFGCWQVRRRGGADVGAQHAELENEPFGFDALLDFAQLIRCELRRSVGDLHEHRLELVEERGHAILSAVERGAPVEPVADEQFFGALLFRGDVDVVVWR